MQIHVYNGYENWNFSILVGRVVSRYTHESVVDTHSVLPNIGEPVKKKGEGQINVSTMIMHKC